MDVKFASEYIIRRRQKCLLKIQNKGRIHFFRDMLMGHHRGKKQNKINYRIEEWHTSKPYDIYRNQSTYLTVCLLLDTWHRTDNCIRVIG